MTLLPGNAAFHRRAGRFAGSLDLLSAAGFRSGGGGGGSGGSGGGVGGGGGGGDGGGDVSEVIWKLTRDDPALLYVVRSAVCDAATRARGIPA
jgi:hypothetical protein